LVAVVLEDITDVVAVVVVGLYRGGSGGDVESYRGGNVGG
jgi:hypothetical protein